MRILELHAPYFRALWRREHDVIAWGPDPHCDLRSTRLVTRLAEILARLPPGWMPDLILLGDDSRLLRVLGLEDPPCPTVMLSIDAHHHSAWHAPLAGAFDRTWVAQRDFLPAYTLAGADAHWLPLWAPDDLPEPAAEKAHDVAFVGTLNRALNPDRVVLVEALVSRMPLHVATGRWEEVFGRSRIVLNQTVKGDLNFRVFEGMASGALLLTERTGNGLLDLFTDGEELVTYPRGDVDAIIAAARRWLADERGRGAVAERGRARVLADHRESQRASRVLAEGAAIETLRPVPSRYAALARTYCILAHLAERLATRIAGCESFTVLAAQYLMAAGELVARPVLPDADRRAVQGMIALERGDLIRAREHLDWAARAGARVEDHLALIETLVRSGDLPGARRAAETLHGVHPGYVMRAEIAQALDLMTEAASG